MSNLDIKMAKLEKDMEYIKEKLDDFIETADNKYAPRWIVTILSWVAGICSVVIAVIDEDYGSVTLYSDGSNWFEL